MTSEEENHNQKEIPKIIYICHKNIKCLSMTYTFWKHLNPNYEIKLFDDAMCEKFLLDQFSELHRSIFKFIPDGPIKSDFWRLCILYKFGGIYVDADIHPLVPLDKYLMRSCDFVTCITKWNGNFNPHFIAARKNDPILKECIEEYIKFYNNQSSYGYWEWSIVHVFNKILSDIKNYHNKMPTSQVFTMNNKKYQLFFEIKKHNHDNHRDNIKNIMTNVTSSGLHDYYCSFLNKRIFNTRYNNYDPYEHSFKNHSVRNQLSIYKIYKSIGVQLSKLTNMKKMKNH
jgi:mannosyltransferase OCH1-like enzyme